MEEKLIQIQSETELVPGALVVLKDCMNCRRSTHRFILIGAGPAEISVGRSGEPRLSQSYNVAPVACRRTGRMIFRTAIQEGRLFRIDTGLKDEENPYTKVVQDVYRRPLSIS